MVLAKQRLREGRNRWMREENVRMWKRQTTVCSGDKAVGEEWRKGGDARGGGTEQILIHRSRERSFRGRNVQQIKATTASGWSQEVKQRDFPKTERKEVRQNSISKIFKRSRTWRGRQMERDTLVFALFFVDFKMICNLS